MIIRKELEGGFGYIEVKNASAEAKIALQGAHIFEYKRNAEEPLLWLSEASDFKRGKAIRGGVPVCWPWFGFCEDRSLPQHGFARISMWEFLGGEEIDEGTTSLRFGLTHSEDTLKLWPYRFELELHVSVSDRLSIELKTTNTDDRPFKITQALHTYFRVSHILHVRVEGLDKNPYLDALTRQNEVQEGDITFDKEVDRVYQEVHGEVVLKDMNRTVHVKNEGSSSVVVWNPWIEKTKRMSAMREDAYERFVCIESANAFDDARIIEAGGSHSLVAAVF